MTCVSAFKLRTIIITKHHLGYNAFSKWSYPGTDRKGVT